MFNNPFISASSFIKNFLYFQIEKNSSFLFVLQGHCEQETLFKDVSDPVRYSPMNCSKSKFRFIYPSITSLFFYPECLLFCCNAPLAQNLKAARIFFLLFEGTRL